MLDSTKHTRAVPGAIHVGDCLKQVSGHVLEQLPPVSASKYECKELPLVGTSESLFESFER